MKLQQAIDTLDIALKNYVDDFLGLSDRPVNLSESKHELSANGEIRTTRCINLGDKIEVFQLNDDQYYLRTVGSYDPETGKYTITYDDGDIDVLDMSNEVRWTLQSSQVIIPDTTSIYSEALDIYFKMFSIKDFQPHHT